jgi:cell division septum initiation protein DivIVA
MLNGAELNESMFDAYTRHENPPRPAVDLAEVADVDGPVDAGVVEGTVVEPVAVRETSMAAARLLEIASLSADQLVTEAQQEANSLVATAQMDADRMTASARAEADQLLAAARAEAERVTGEAHAEREQVTADLEAHRNTVLSGLADEQSALEGRLEHLREVEREHRERLRRHFAEQLELVQD